MHVTRVLDKTQPYFDATETLARDQILKTAQMVEVRDA